MSGKKREAGEGETAAEAALPKHLDNPYTRLGLDPWSTPEAITEAMRELAEDAAPEERRHLQGLWRELTLHPDQQLDAAFFAHAHPARALASLEGSGEELVRRFGLRDAVASVPESLREWRPTLDDLVILPPLKGLLGAKAEGAWPDVAPGDDPLLRL